VIAEPPEITAAHEAWQRPGASEQWSDSLYFGGGDGRGLAFYSRIGRRPNEGITEGALGVWLPGQGFLLSFAREPTTPEVACGPVRFDCVEPLLLWELRLEGRGRLFERAEHVATARSNYREVELNGELRFTAWHDPLAFHSGLSSAVASKHYEQPGSIAGVLEVDGRRSPLAGNGLRDHSWGVRDWQRVPYWRWFGVVLDPDTYALVNNVGHEDGGETAGGFLMRDGVLAPVVACETESELDPDLGCQRSFSARARDESGRETLLEGRALEVAPLRQRRDGRLTLVNEALTEYHWEGRTAVGISEYLIQQPDAEGRIAKAAAGKEHD
jgi:hypothetical protein